MLGRLMKYEIKATGRIFLPLYGLILAFAGLNRLFMYFNLQKKSDFLPNFVSGISMLVYILLVAAAFVITLVVTVQRFRKNLLGDEGYLSFTLPVAVHSHIDSKMIVSLMWSVLSTVVALLSVAILAIGSGLYREIASGWDSVRDFFSQYGASGWGCVVSIVVLLLAAQLSGILSLYVSVVVGNLSGRHKRLAGFGTFLGIGVIAQVVFFSFANTSGVFQSYHDVPLDSVAQMRALSTDCLILAVFCAAFGVAFYFLTDWMLSRKLNLE